MRRWRCIYTENSGFTIGKIYKSSDDGYNIVDDEGFCFGGLSAHKPLKSDEGFESTKFEEVFDDLIDREFMIDKLDNEYCSGRSCDDCVFTRENDNFDNMTDEDLINAYNLAFGVKVENKKEDKKVNKFKVGDKVMILDGSKIKDYTGGFVYEMKQNIGKLATIASIEMRGERYCYFLVEYGCIYDERGLELANKLNKSLTITTSDSTTTLTDGTHTTTVNRYYTDKHDEKVAVEYVVKKYYDELAEIDRVSKTPKVGDKVRVVDNGRTHSTYDKWLIKNNVNLKSAIKWRNGLSPKNGGEYTIKEIHKNEYFDIDLALIEDGENAYIINIKGIEVVK